MLSGIIKTIVILAAASLADHYFYDGIYTDAACSLLRQMRHSFT